MRLDLIAKAVRDDVIVFTAYVDTQSISAATARVSLVATFGIA